MSDITTPVNKNELAQERVLNVPRPAAVPSLPNSPPSATPSSLLAGLEDLPLQQGESEPVITETPTVPDQNAPPLEEHPLEEQPLQQTGSQETVLSTPSYIPERTNIYSPMETPTPSYNGVDYYQTINSDYNRIAGQVEKKQQSLLPESLINTARAIPQQPQQFAGRYETDISGIRKTTRRLEQENAHRTAPNTLGLQDVQYNIWGERANNNVSAVANAIVTNGLVTNIGKDLQDKYDPNLESNNVNHLLGWLDSASKFGRGAFDWLTSQGALKVVELVETLPTIAGTGGFSPGTQAFLDRTKEGLQQTADAAVFGGTYKELEGGRPVERTSEGIVDLPYNMGLTNLIPLDSRGILPGGAAPAPGSTPNSLNLAQWEFGDYGNHPLLSPALYLLNVPQQILLGFVYDTSDLLFADKSNPVIQRSRILDALGGARDYGLSNRWTDYKYLSLQEPYNFTAGTLAKDSPEYRDNPLAGYWDFPEWFAGILGQAPDSDLSRQAHIVFQTVPAFVGEFVTGGLGDRLILEGIPQAIRNSARVGKSFNRTVSTVPTVPTPAPKIPDIDVPSSPDIDIPQTGTPRTDGETSTVVDLIEDPTTGKLRPRVPGEEPPLDNFSVPNDPSKTISVEETVISSEFDVPVRTSTGITFEPVQLKIPTTRATSLDLEGLDASTNTIFKAENLLSGNRRSTRVVVGTREQNLSNLDLTLIFRNNEDLTEIARLTVNPETGTPLHTANRILSDEEISAFQKQYGNLFDRYGQGVPYFNDGDLIDVNGTLLRVDRSAYKEVNDLPQYRPSNIVETYNRQRNLGRTVYSTLVNKEPVEIVDTASKRFNAQTRRLTIFNGNEPYTSKYTTAINTGRIPQELTGTTDAAITVGTKLVEAENAIANHRGVIDQLLEEADKLRVKVKNIEDVEIPKLQYRRGNITQSLTNKETYTGVQEEALRLRIYQGGGELPKLPYREDGRQLWYQGKTAIEKQQYWLHGSTSPIPIKEVDIVAGGTPSELGLAVYLTRTQSIADEAATAFPTSNRPPRPDSSPTVPYRITVDTDELDNVINLDAAPSGKLVSVFNTAATEVLGKEVANTLYGASAFKKPANSLWTRFVEEAKAINVTVSPLQVREFQQVVTRLLVANDFDAGISKGILAVYNPSKLKSVGASVPLETPTLLKQLASRASLDRNLSSLYGSPSLLDFATESNYNFISGVYQDTLVKLSKEQFVQKELFEVLITEEFSLSKLVEDFTKKRVAELSIPVGAKKYWRVYEGDFKPKTPLKYKVESPQGETLVINIESFRNRVAKGTIPPEQIVREVNYLKKKVAKAIGINEIYISKNVDITVPDRILRDFHFLVKNVDIFKGTTSDVLYLGHGAGRLEFGNWRVAGLDETIFDHLDSTFPTGTRVTVVACQSCAPISLAEPSAFVPYVVGSRLSPDFIKAYNATNGVGDWEIYAAVPNGNVVLRRQQELTGVHQYIQINKNGEFNYLSSVYSNLTNESLDTYVRKAIAVEVSVNKQLGDFILPSPIKLSVNDTLARTEIGSRGALEFTENFVKKGLSTPQVVPPKIQKYLNPDTHIFIGASDSGRFAIVFNTKKQVFTAMWDDGLETVMEKTANKTLLSRLDTDEKFAQRMQARTDTPNRPPSPCI